MYVCVCAYMTIWLVSGEREEKSTVLLLLQVQRSQRNIIWKSCDLDKSHFCRVVTCELPIGGGGRENVS